MCENTTMTITTLSSREFNQDSSKAKHAAQSGPVIITDRGRPAHVLLTFADYKKLTAQPTRMTTLLAMSAAGDFEFDPPKSNDIAQAADFS